MNNINEQMFRNLNQYEKADFYKEIVKICVKQRGYNLGWVSKDLQDVYDTRAVRGRV